MLTREIPTTNVGVMTLAQVVDALHGAAKDPRVAGLLVNTGAQQAFTGLAHVEELRNAILHFRCFWFTLF